MATAPRPVDIADDDDEQITMRITCEAEGLTLELHQDDIGPRDNMICQQQTGFPVEAFFGAERLSSASVLILWWMARRKAGERALMYRKVEKRYATGKKFREAGFSVEMIGGDDEDDDLEDEDDVEEVGAEGPTNSGDDSRPSGPTSPSGTGTGPGGSAATPS